MKWQFDKYLALAAEQRQKRHSLRWVLAGGILVSLLKLYAFVSTNSNAILSDVMESLINLAATCFSLYSLEYAGQPRDSKHPFGHGKMESLSATVQGSLIFLAGTSIILKAAYNLVHPNPLDDVTQGIVFIAAGGAANMLLGRYLLKRSKRLNSIILQADGRRIMSDAWSSGALVLGLAVMYFVRIPWLDCVFALISGFVIIRTGIKIVRSSVKGLLDAADSVMLEEVVRVMQMNSSPSWIDIQDVRASHHGYYIYIDCRITMPWYWNLLQVNQEVRSAELIINQHFKERVDIFVQSEPCQPRNCPGCRISDCPVRQHPFREGPAWKLNDVVAEEQVKKLG